MCGLVESDIGCLSWVSPLFKIELVPIVKSIEIVGVYVYVIAFLNRNVNTEFGGDDCRNIFLHSTTEECTSMPGNSVLSGTV